jgi:hypothetical protein
MYSKALFISAKGTRWVMNFSTSSSWDNNLARVIKLVEIIKKKKNRRKSQSRDDSRLKIYLVHVFLHHRGKIRARLVVTKKGTLQSPPIQKVYRLSLKDSIFGRHTHNNGEPPTLPEQF